MKLEMEVKENGGKKRGGRRKIWGREDNKREEKKVLHQILNFQHVKQNNN